MTAVMNRLHRRLPRRQRYPLPPREIIDVMAGPARLTEHQMRTATTGAHFAYGALTGAGLAALRSRPATAEGAAYGLAIWAGSYFGWIPAAGVLKPAGRHPAERNALMILAHLVWGAATALAIREIAAAEDHAFSADCVGARKRDAYGTRDGFD